MIIFLSQKKFNGIKKKEGGENPADDINKGKICKIFMKFKKEER